MNGISSKIIDKLSIVIITYNRSTLLSQTLKFILESPFKDCEIIVLDNCSKDDTILVCEQFVDKFKNLSVKSHKFNIGANANILRAYEVTNNEYLWILADDDEYDFSYCQDVIDQILIGEVDLIQIGGHTDEDWLHGGKMYETQSLISEGYRFFRFSSFLPSSIFRTSTIHPYIIDGYNNICNLYPHMPYLLSYYVENKDIYISKNRIVKAIIGHQGYSFTDSLKGWYNTSKLLKNKKDIQTCFYDQFTNKDYISFLSLFYNNYIKTRNVSFDYIAQFWILLSFKSKIKSFLYLFRFLMIKLGKQ